MFKRILVLSTFFLTVGLAASPALAQKKAAPLSTGDQAKVEIAKGFFMDSEVGLLTYLVTDGSFIYKPGILVSLRIGAHIGNNFSIFGKIGSTVTGNTSLYSNASRARLPGGTTFRSKFPTPANPILRSVPRQGVSLIAGLGARWYYLKLLDERFCLHLTLEGLFHMIPADNLPEDRFNRLTDAEKKTLAAHLNPAIGGAVGFGFGFEYFFIIKHFSFGANILSYFFLTEVLPGSFLGLSVLAAVDIKYTFW